MAIGHPRPKAIETHSSACCEQVVDDLGVRLALRLLHHLTHEEADRVELAGSDLVGGLGVLGDHLVDGVAREVLVRDLLSPFLVATSSASRPVANISSSTSFACLPEMVPSSTSPTSRASCCGRIFVSCSSCPASFSRPKRSAVIQLATFLASPVYASAAASNQSASCSATR